MNIKAKAMDTGGAGLGAANADGCPRRLNFTDVPGSSGRFYPQKDKTMTDMDYIRSMEERYSIREEGIF